MSSRTRISDLHRLTRRSLENTTRPADDPRSYGCGCWPTTDGWIYLCQYHDGVEVGIEMAENDAAPAVEQDRP